MKRRGVLKIVGGGALALAGGGGFLFLRATKMVPVPAEPLVFFSPREFSIFSAIAETVIQVPAGQPTVLDAQVGLRADRLLASHSADDQRDFHRLLGLFDNALAGLLFTGTTAPFSQCSIAGREAILAKWSDHRLGVLRSGYQALKRLAGACYYGNPVTHAGLGYPGPPEIVP